VHVSFAPDDVKAGIVAEIDAALHE
jgi:hypothetical protein